MVAVFSLQVMREWEGWGVVDFCYSLGGVTRVGYHIFSVFYVFVLLLIVLSWVVHDSLLCVFHCSFFAFFVSGPLN